MADDIKVTLPDGRTVYFPAGTPPEVMESAVRDYVGWTPPEPESSAMDTAVGIAKAAGSGIAQGAEFAAKIPDYVGSGISYLLEKPMSMVGAGISDLLDKPVRLERITPEQRQQIPAYFRPTDRDVISKAAEALTGGGIRYEPQGRVEKIVQAGGAGLPLGALGGARAALVEGVLPSMASEYAGQIFEGSALEPIARIVAGIGTPSAIEGSRRLMKTGQLNVPKAVTPERITQTQNLADMGILPTVGQIADDPILMAREAATQVGRDLSEQQLEAFTSQALKLAGVNAKRATADVLDDAFVKAGKQFDDIAARASIPIDEGLAANFSEPINDFLNTLATPQVPKYVQDIADEFNALQVSGREITGAEYQKISRLLRTLKSRPNPDLKKLGKDLEEVMVEALGQSLSPRDMAKYSQIKAQYRNLDTITNAVDIRTGLVRPNALVAKETAKSGKRSVARGKMDLAQLAAEADMLRALPQSGTAPRSAAEGAFAGAMSAIPTTIGVGAATGGDLLQTLAAGGIAGVAGGLSAARNRAMNEMIGSEYGQDFLRQYLMGRGRPLLSPLPAGGLLPQLEQN